MFNIFHSVLSAPGVEVIDSIVKRYIDATERPQKCHISEEVKCLIMLHIIFFSFLLCNSVCADPEHIYGL